MNILVTGSSGFIGRNLVTRLARDQSYRLWTFDLDDASARLEEGAESADVVLHLAGVNRPPTDDEFQRGNAEFTDRLCALLERRQTRPRVVLSSSVQATVENAYGRSKLAAEQRLLAYAERAPGAAVIFRLPNVFGKWARPNYNSAVATFCHNICRDLPVQISDPARVLELAYVDDVVQAFVDAAAGDVDVYRAVTPTYQRSLGQLVTRLKEFRASRQTLRLPDLDAFDRKLYATYLSHLDTNDLSYSLHQKTDPRGALAEFMKTGGAGQIFVSRTKPGVTRGNHYHHTKTEKFLVLEGQAVIRFRSLLGGDVIEVPVSGLDFRVVDIPPGYTHSIENVGVGELITLFWASEVFDPATPDTYALDVELSRPSAVSR